MTRRPWIRETHSANATTSLRPNTTKKPGVAECKREIQVSVQNIDLKYSVHGVPHSMHLNVNELAILVDGSATGIALDRSKSGPKQGFLKVEV